MHQVIDVLNLKILTRLLDIWLQFDLTKILRSLRYKSEVREFHFRWFLWNFSLT